MNNKINIEKNVKLLQKLEDVNKYNSIGKAIENVLTDREKLQAKANAYDSLTEDIKDMLKKEKEEVKYFSNINDEVAKRHAYTANALEELLDTKQ